MTIRIGMWVGSRGDAIKLGFDVRATRDVRVPLVDGDDELNYGWRNVGVRPTAEAGWFVVDDTSDKKTVWARWTGQRGRRPLALLTLPPALRGLIRGS